MNKIHYRGQKFKKRLTKEELKDIASDTFVKNGMDKYIQSNVLAHLYDYVKKSKNPKFFSLVSNPKYKNTIAWIRAYSLVLKFLEEYKMTSTINTMNKESERLKIAYNFNFFNQSLPSQFLKDSIRIQQRNRKKFSIRVSLFKMPPPLISNQIANDNSKKNILSNYQQMKNNYIESNLHNNLANEEASYISGDENSHFNVSSIDVLADESIVDNE